MKKKHICTGFIFGLTLIVQIASQPLVSADESGKAQIEGSIAGIGWGEHWAGTEVLGPVSLRGKVVLLKIWGG